MNFKHIRNLLITTTMTAAITCVVSNYCVSFASEEASKVIDIENHWGKGYITTMIDSGVVSGYPGGLFKPDNTISVPEFVTVLVKQMNYEMKDMSIVNSEVEENWFDDFIFTGQENGILSGLSMNNIERNITRAEMARMIAKAAGLEDVNSSSFTDNDEITEEYEGSIYAVSQAGIIGGYPDGSFGPSKQATRAEACVMLTNLMNYQTANEAEEVVTEEKEDLHVTEWGDVKKPTNMNPNENLWTDEEFHKILTVDREDYYPILKINLKNDYIGQWDYQRQAWFYDPDLKHFVVQGEYLGLNEKGQHISEYMDVDALTDGRMFDTMKIVMYQAHLNDMDLNISDQSGRVWIDINAQKTGYDNIDFFVVYDATNSEPIYGQIEGYDSSESPVMTEWAFKNLYDWSYYTSLVDNYFELTTYERQELTRSFGFTEQKYNDVIYGICDALYGEDAERMYLFMMQDHIDSLEYGYVNETYSEEMKIVEINSHNVLKYDPQNYQRFYGVSEK